MNKPLRRVAICALLLFMALFINLNWMQVVRSRLLRKDPGNTRVLPDEYDRQRGSIVVDGNAIAMSVGHQGPAELPAAVPRRPGVRRRHRLLLARLRQLRHRAGRRTTCSPAPTRGFVRLHRRPVHRPRPRRRRRHPDPRRRGPETPRTTPSARRGHRRRRRHRAPRPARFWRWPARRPTTRMRCPATTRTAIRKRRAATRRAPEPRPARQPGHQRALPARLGVQDDRLRRGAVPRASSCRRPAAGAGPATLPGSSTSWPTTTAKAATRAARTRCCTR